MFSVSDGVDCYDVQGQVRGRQEIGQAAEVMGSLQTGGLLGINNTSQVTDSFFNEALAPLAGSTGITPLSNDDMARLESFTGFDFGGTWEIIPDESYPFLQWQEGIFIPEKLMLD